MQMQHDYSNGDARRCPRHPSVITSSDDGLIDAPCGHCECEIETGNIFVLGPYVPTPQAEADEDFPF